MCLPNDILEKSPKSQKQLLHRINLFFSFFLFSQIYFHRLPLDLLVFSTTFGLHLTYPGGWWPLCPKARWRHLRGLPARSWRSRHWGSECCWAAGPPSAPSRSGMPWRARRDVTPKGGHTEHREIALLRVWRSQPASCFGEADRQRPGCHGGNSKRHYTHLGCSCQDK